MELEEFNLKEDFNLKDYILNVPDFPKKGINFKDISPILANPEAFHVVMNSFELGLQNITKIVGLDARGFIFASVLAYKTGLPFVMLRKKGKLPGDTEDISYDLEYGSNTFQIKKGSIVPGDKVAIVDDLIATGGSIKAGIDLIERLGGEVSSVNAVIELEALNGRKLFNDKVINILVKY